MFKKEIISNFMRGEYKTVVGYERTPIARFLQALIPIDTVGIIGPVGSRPMVASDRMELAPGLSLGDIIDEELGLNVSYGTIVISLSEGMYHPQAGEDISYQVGFIIGEAIISIVSKGLFSLEDENEAIFIMASSYAKISESFFLRDLGLKSADFKLGLGASLGKFWSGTTSDQISSIFLRPDFLETLEVRQYLTALGGSFSAPMFTEVPRRIMMMTASIRSEGDWLTVTRVQVSAQLEPKPAMKEIVWADSRV